MLTFSLSIKPGVIQIINDTFGPILDPPSPMYHLMIPARTLPLPAWHVIFQITSFFRLYVNSSKKGKICHLTLWLTPSLPHVLFGDTVATREPPSPPPIECHVLFEWPLTKLIIKSSPENLGSISSTFYKQLLRS
jgi:hypothetical protein